MRKSPSRALRPLSVAIISASPLSSVSLPPPTPFLRRAIACVCVMCVWVYGALASMLARAESVIYHISLIQNIGQSLTAHLRKTR